MSVAAELSRIQADRNTIRDKLIELGLATSTSNLTALAAAIEDIVNQGAVQVEILEGTSYTIPAGYHNGSGTVKALTDTAGEAETYKLQAKTITPTKSNQSVTPDTGYYALSAVTVNAIPEAYQNVSSVTADAGDVLVGKVIVTADGKVTTGTMANNGGVSQTLSATTVTYTIPKGYHDGTGTVKIVLEEKSVTPTKSTQTVTPTSGKLLSKVTVGPIPDNYIDTTDADATAENILAGKFAYVDGVKVEGTMPLQSDYQVQLSAANAHLYTIPEGYHDGTTEIYIKTTTKTVTPTKKYATYTAGSDGYFRNFAVNPIPDEYQDVTGVTAGADDVLAGKDIVASDGTVTPGTMPNNGAVSETIDGLTNTSVVIPAGYTSGGTVSLTSDIEEALAAI